MGNMGFFNEEIIYGAEEHMAPAEFLPHSSGYYEQVNQRLCMSTGYRHNYRTMAAPISVLMGDPIPPIGLLLLGEEILRPILPDQVQMLQDKSVVVDQLFLMTTPTENQP
ncbi:hypothetical protein E2562_031907 [Oryza meyeriana var. granulata]|uniref:Uncharacterized protein n=1 Tax=Oryza meyeriana var. granulata TaxID=110450 RepID=A0A6G1BP84_9ORYZ|nr:hypothetical protein E2562_031907 [Oryza meyeriana var. granulata]